MDRKPDALIAVHKGAFCDLQCNLVSPMQFPYTMRTKCDYTFLN
jgi:hypothetical protein